MKRTAIIGISMFVLLLFVFFIYSRFINPEIKEENCAKEGEQFSWVYKEDYPEHCCNTLTEWQSGMDTSIAIGDKCYETGAMAGSPVGTCISCGNNICESIETPCNCPDDCINAENSDYASVEEFCSSTSWKTLSKECGFGLDLPICSIC